MEQFFNDFQTFKDYDFSQNQNINKVTTLGHRLLGIGSAKFIKIGITQGASWDGSMSKVITPDGSIWKLISFPITPEHFGAIPRNEPQGIIVGLNVPQINTVAINKFFIEITEIDVQIAAFGGDYEIDQPIFFGKNKYGDIVQSIATKHLIGSPKITLKSEKQVDTIFTIHGFRLSKWDGRISVTASGRSWEKRGALYGVKLSGCGRSLFGGFVCNNIAVYGVLCSSELFDGGNTTMINLGDCRFTFCGSGLWGKPKSIENNTMHSNWSNPEKYSVQEKNGNLKEKPFHSYASIKTDEMPSSEMLERARKFPMILMENGDLHKIIEINRKEKRIIISPGLDSSLTTTRMKWIFGGGIALRGSDVGIVKIGSIDAVNSSISLDIMTFYGPVVDRIVNHYCFLGAFFNARSKAQSSTVNIHTLYTEGNYQAFSGPSTGSNVNISGTYDIDFEKDIHLLESRNRNYDLVSHELVGYNVSRGGENLSFEKRGRNRSEKNSGIRFKIENKNTLTTYRQDAKKVILEINQGRNKQFGFDSGQLTFIGSGSNHAPTGEFAFISEEAIYTVNGKSEFKVKGFSGPAIFSIYFDFEKNDFIVAVTNLI